MVELWGGHECTVVRTRDGYRDQTVLSGHQERPEDLDLFAELGLSALRYPIIWERISPAAPDLADWTWSDGRLNRLKDLGVRPIAGLTHHGGGPAYTGLLEDTYAPGLAAHAAAAARRYPWIRDWTPVNEPLTTARFSTLYGLWHPHRRDEPAFWRALLNQIDAVRLSMRAIRAIRPDARLIQTEDLGRTYSTPAVRQQADFENHRRWMTWDLLAGLVTKDHPLWDRLVGAGLGENLRRIADDPCPADVIGVNHYLTSERFLDARLERYPVRTHGGNGSLAYADVEAIRVLDPPPAGLEGVLREACARYGKPVAVTELHNGCTREEQMRWFLEGWTTGRALADEGLPVVAVTAWSLLGSYDWNSLLTRADGHYEPGVFDLRSGVPRPTAMSRLLKGLAGGQEPPLAALGEGWWRRGIRLEHPLVDARIAEQIRPPARRSAGRPLLIAGATGTLGQALARACEVRGLAYVLTDRGRMDLSDPGSIAGVLEEIRPWAVVNATGWVRVDEAEAREADCMATNAAGAARLAQACEEVGAPTVTFSSDLVFDGKTERAYVEDDPPAPLSAYGRSKAEAERQILALPGAHLVIRTSAFFSAHDPYNFAAAVLRAAREGQTFLAADDLRISPTHTPELADATLDLLIDGETGLWHLANGADVSWAEFARMVCDVAGLPEARIEPVCSSRFGWPAPRPQRSILGTRRGAVMKPLDAALESFARQLGR